MEFKEGDKVRHKLRGEEYRVVAVVDESKRPPVRCVCLTKSDGKLWFFSEIDLELVEEKKRPP